MKTQVSLWATPEEIKQLEQIRVFHKRSTISDTIRFLITQESENFLSQNISNEISKGATP